MVIGRSGTGKTTCAILRLFSQEMLFKIRMTLYKNKNEKLLKNTRFDSVIFTKNFVFMNKFMNKMDN